MNPLISISSAEPAGGIYLLTYFLSFALTIGLLIYQGFRRKFPMLSWLLLIGVAAFLFTIGSKLGTFGMEDWKYAWESGHLPFTSAKTIEFGILGLLLGLELGRRTLGLPASAIDTIALALPLGMIVQQFGCLFAGCCFGTPSGLPWAMEYDGLFPVCAHQYREGILQVFPGASAPIHPVPVYRMLAYVLVFSVVFKFRKTFHCGGSLGYFSLGLLFLAMFGIEFFRDPATNHHLGGFWGGLKLIQWILVGGMFLFAAILIRKERKHHGLPILCPVLSVSLRLILLGAVFASGLWFMQQFLAIEEVWVLSLLLTVVLAVGSIQWARVAAPGRIRAIGFLLLAGAFLMQSQTYIDWNKKEALEKQGLDRKNSLALKGMYGRTDIRYMESHYERRATYDCDGNVTGSEDFLDTTFQAEIRNTTGIGFIHEAYSIRSSQQPSVGIFGWGAFYFPFKERIPATDEVRDKTYFGGMMYGGGYYEYFGFKAGLHVGQLFWFSDEPLHHHKKGNIDTNLNPTLIFPLAEVRLGNMEKAYLIGGVGGAPLEGIYQSWWRASLGLNSGLFRLKPKFQVELGIRSHFTGIGFLGNAFVDINPRFRLLGTFAAGKDGNVFGLGFMFNEDWK